MNKFVSIILSVCFVAWAGHVLAQDSIVKKIDSLKFPIQDRRGDPFTVTHNNPFDLHDSAFIKQNWQYDPKTNQYNINESIGNSSFRKPSYLSFEEFYKLKTKQSEAQYFKDRASALSDLNQKTARPKMQVYRTLFDRIFGLSNVDPKSIGNDLAGKVDPKKLLPGGLKVDIRPAGSVDVLLGYQRMVTNNPTLPEKARKTGGVDFNMNANVNVNANIGDKLKLPINYNTLANFDYLNQLKLDYKGKDDEILKSFEAGNMSFQTKSTLIPSAQNLFGIKTQLQFGRLFVTAALANQKSQRQNQTLQGGAALTTFQKKLDDYDENRHFLLGQYFKNTYNNTMSKLPIVSSNVQIQRIEVWVTNKNGATTDTRDIVALADLGESSPSNPSSASLPDNASNSLYGMLSSASGSAINRDPSKITTVLRDMGLSQVQDFEKTFARKLNPNEYYLNPQVGFISLNAQLQPDEVLAVAYQYTYNGRVYQVGEFSQNIALDSSQGVQKVLFLKMLKATSARVQLPIWQLMMKNVYSLDLSGISKDGFKLNVLYQQPSGGLNNYLPEADATVDGKPLLKLLNLDRLNSRNDPQPDGVFDYIEGFTVLSQQGKIIFPVLKPFGEDLEKAAFNTPAVATAKTKYLYPQLYDSIKAIAQTYANLNRYVLKGQAKGSSGSSEIYLGAFNIPQGSVKVTAGGQILTENVDYAIDYNLGSVKILNQAIVNSGVPVNVSYENNNSFGTLQRGFLGLRLDYVASKKLSIGATYERLNERPFFSKNNYGEDPIRNSMFGVDVNYKSNLPGLTRFLNKLPFYSTKAMSSISAYGEGAYFKPGHPPQIGKGSAGLIYIDDFEGTRSSIDLRFPANAWALASTPTGALFPEASLTNNLDYGKQRAKIAWYNIEPTLQDPNSQNNPTRSTNLKDPRVRLVYTNELFPNQTTTVTNTQTTTFDLAYYPKDMGPYNYENSTSEVDANGKFKNPQNKWGGIMRSIDQTDFETNNFEFVEFWIQDPFIKTPNNSGGKLHINLGSISEDILKDGKRFYENGMNTPNIPTAIDTNTVWGRVPVNPIQVTQSFSNDANDRAYQDVGFDGLGDDSERVKFNSYVSKVTATFPGTPFANRALSDPSNDNYKWYRDGNYDALNADILSRYKNYNNPQGNSPVSSGNASSAATLYPDNEDLNKDNTLNENEEYYDYEIDINPSMSSKYITDRRTVTVRNGIPGTENWYLFRVPIKDYAKKVGNIPDFKSIRFVRMYLAGFDDSVVLRFAKLDVVRNNWRQFTYELDTTGSYTPRNNSVTSFNTLAVNLEENSSRTPVNYVIPPGIERVQQLSNSGVNILQNEQAMSLKVSNLLPGSGRAVFKTFNLDIRKYGTMSMFTHAESVVGATPLADKNLNIVVRIGQDYLNNYYEIKIPLKITPPGKYTSAQAETVWPTDNNLDFNIADLINAKTHRNSKQLSYTNIYREFIGNKIISVLGSPNLGQVTGMLIGVENASGIPVTAELWVNELRLSNIDEHGAYAALGRVDVTLADLGKASFSASTTSTGWGTLESHINDRANESLLQLDAALNIDAGKLLPKQLGLEIPVYASISKTTKKPLYDPYDLDIKLSDKLNAAKNKAEKDSIKNAAIDQTTVKTINFTNVKVKAKGKPHIYNLSNFDATYSYTQTTQSNPTVLSNSVKKWRGSLGYTFNKSTKYIEPFKTIIKSKSKWVSLIKDFNFNFRPSLISFRGDVNRQFAQYIPRIVNTDLSQIKVQRVDTTYDKFFNFDRYYNLRWDLTRSLNLDFSATNNARVDEPYGALDTKAKIDSVKTNFFKGGRNILYQQRTSSSYTLPLNKLPITDWITARYSYNTNYNWIAASLLAQSLGNTIENGQENVVNGEFDLTRLYSKSRYLRALTGASGGGSFNNFNNNALPNNNKKTPQKGKPGAKDIKLPNLPALPNTGLATDVPARYDVIRDKEGNKLAHHPKHIALKKWRKLKRDIRIAERLKRRAQPIELNTAEKVAGHLLTMLKRVSINYSENFRSRIPGYKDSTQILGQNWKSMQPGLDYVFGRQPDSNWLNDKAARGLISRDTNFNSLYRQNFEQKFRLTAQLEPIKELTIDISFEKSFSKEYTELFKDSSNSGAKLQHLNPYASGGFSVSYVAINTLFQKSNPNQISETFKKFEANRVIISQRLAQQNPYWQKLAPGSQYQPDGYAYGYGRYAQNVLIPSFLAAYTGKSAKSIALLKESNGNIKSNPFSGILPKPNWRLNYTGLSKIPALAQLFTSINILHAYNGTLSMNSFTSALNYSDTSHFSKPSFYDTVSKNYVPFYLVPNISIQEQFAPLIGFDVTTVRQVSFKFEYKKSRQLSLSLVDYQLSETKSTEWLFGIGWRKRGLALPFKLPFMTSKKLTNDISFKLDVSKRDDATSNSRLDQSNAYGTGGQKVISIQPSIDYVLSNRLNIKLFFDQKRTTPYISTSPPTVATRAGLQVRISLAP